MTRLSHSAANRYSTCPQSYKLHYIDRIRSTKLGSALLFGGAMDEALNRLLATKMTEHPDEIDGIKFADYATDSLEKLKNGFDHYMTYQMVGKELEDVRTSHFIEYYGSDFDPYIFTDVELGSLRTFIKNAGYEEEDPFELYREVSSNIKAKKTIAYTDQSFYNFASWLSLKRKGHLMLGHYIKEIMPIIDVVKSVQRAIELPNESGDTLIGFIDFEASVIKPELVGGFPEWSGQIITFDNKTSAKPYKKQDINDKGQLLIYDEYTQNGLAGYIVLIKKIGYHKELTCRTCGEITRRAVKSCPEGGTGKNRCGGELDLERLPYVKHQILMDSVDEEKKDLLFDELCAILVSIENEEFPQKRLDEKGYNNCFQFGKNCIYHSYCRSCPNNPDITGLVKV